MTKYRVNLVTTASALLEVEADDRESAIDAAYDRAPSICAQCSGWGREGVYLEIAGDWELPTDGPDDAEAEWAVEEA